MRVQFELPLVNDGCVNARSRSCPNHRASRGYGYATSHRAPAHPQYGVPGTKHRIQGATTQVPRLVPGPQTVRHRPAIEGDCASVEPSTDDSTRGPRHPRIPPPGVSPDVVLQYQPCDGYAYLHRPGDPLRPIVHQGCACRCAGFTQSTTDVASHPLEVYGQAPQGFSPHSVRQPIPSPNSSNSASTVTVQPQPLVTQQPALSDDHSAGPGLRVSTADVVASVQQSNDSTDSRLARSTGKQFYKS